MLTPVLLFTVLGLINQDVESQTSPMASRYPGAGRRPRARDNVTAVGVEEGVVGVGPEALQRVAELLVALQALDQQQLRRLETLEYKLTRLEVQHQDKIESMRADLREVSTRVQQVDWSVGKMEASVESIKIDMAGVRDGLDSLRNARVGSPLAAPPSEGDSKLHAISSSLHTVRNTLAALLRDMAVVRSNATQIANITHTVSRLHSQQVSQQSFTAAMLDLKQSHHVTCPTPRDTDSGLPRDCWEVQARGENRSGVYKIAPPGMARPFYAYCQLDTLGGGWTVFQQRSEGGVDFYRGWLDYKHGFGNLAGEFWLGLEKLHRLTDYTVHELLVELQDFNEQNATARYEAFAISSELEGYAISLLGAYDGDAGDSLLYHAGHKFSTSDADNDGWPDGSCAESHAGSWWYNGCDNSNLNGRYLSGELPEHYQYKGMYWYDWHGPSYSLQASRMSVRPYQPRRSQERKPKPRRVITERTTVAAMHEADTDE